METISRKVIIERIRAELAAINGRQYTSDGDALFTVDPTVISIDYHVKSGTENGTVNVYGTFDGFLTLKPQIDLRSKLNDLPRLLQQVKDDISAIEAKLNAEI